MKEAGIFVTGATGFIGRHLVDRLLRDSKDVHVFTRSPEKVSQIWKDKLFVIEGDLCDKKLVIPKDVEVVFHCAAELEDKRGFETVNIEGTRNIVKACLAQNNCRLVYLSSVGVIGAAKEGLVNEDAVCFPRNDYEESKLEAEEIVKEESRKHKLSSVILRPSIVYGQGITQERDSFLALIRAIKNRRFCFIGKKESYYNIVYVEDVVEALIFLGGQSRVADAKVFIINDAVSWNDFAKIVLSALKEKAAVITLPLSIGLFLAVLCELGRFIGVNMPFSLSRYRVLTCKTVFSSDRLIKQVGFRLSYGNLKGIEATLKYYFDQRLL